MRFDLRDRGTLSLVALGAPLVLAAAVIAWGYIATQNTTALPPANAVPIIAIAPDGSIVQIPPTLRPASPTPAFGPGTTYRVEGVIVDELGAPMPDVCIAIGPNGCRDHSPRTDSRGVYFVDFPAADVSYDLHFTKDGYKEIVKRLQPTGDQVLNLVLGH